MNEYLLRKIIRESIKETFNEDIEDRYSNLEIDKNIQLNSSFLSVFMLYILNPDISFHEKQSFVNDSKEQFKDSVLEKIKNQDMYSSFLSVETNLKYIHLLIELFGIENFKNYIQWKLKEKDKKISEAELLIFKSEFPEDKTFSFHSKSKQKGTNFYK